ncbi:MAG: ATP-dependent protease ATPase subunit HslU [Candidatus Kapaibacterium sp.]
MTTINDQTTASQTSSLTPMQIVRELDKYVVGQHGAKRAVAIALRNRWRRRQVGGTMEEEIMPANIILIGPTGVGKTEIARRLAKLADAPFLKVEATKFTEVGYVGRDVESIIRDLAEIGIAMVRAEQAELLQERAEARVEDRLLDLLVPRSTSGPAINFPFMMPGMTAPPQTSATLGETEEEYQRRREEMRAKLQSGTMESTNVEMDVVDDSRSSQMGAMFSSLAGDEMGSQLSELMGSMMPKQTARRTIPISEARRLILHEETTQMIDNESVVREAVNRVENNGIVFLDEIDKVAIVGGGSGPEVSREGVQRDLLPIVEGSTVNTKYGPIRTDHILFVASGAFHISKPSDLLPELQGRFPIRVELNSLTAEDFAQILTMPENALVKQYAALLATEGVELSFNDDGIQEIADVAADLNHEIEDIGARRLQTVLTTLLDELLFDAPDNVPEKKIVVTRAMVKERLSGIFDDIERSQYVL